jgi:dienelactone hydrolase
MKPIVLLFFTWVVCLSGVAQEKPTAVPKMLLVGGGLSEAVIGQVSGLMRERATVVKRSAGARGATGLLSELDGWLAQEMPQVILITPEVNEVAADWEAVVTRLQDEKSSVVIIARAGGDGASWRELGLPVLDLPTDLNACAEAVADSLRRHWSVLRWRGWTSNPASGPEAAAKYRETEEKHDAEVPEMYRNLSFGQFHLPVSADAWKKQRPEVLRVVKESLGDLPPRPTPVKARVISREWRQGYTLERVVIDNGLGNDISALVLVPEQLKQPAPAILWLHSSTPDKNGLITPGATPETLGEVFMRSGYVVVAPDAWYYGDRAAAVPSGPMDEYHRGSPNAAKSTQDALLKLNLWMGRTVWGLFVRDDQIALDYLCQRPEVDAHRVGATGMSMGSTRAWWLAALDERVAATVGVACLTRYENLIRHGNLRAHGLYYFSYGLLKHFDVEGVLSLIAPRPFLALTGDLDYGSPVDGIRVLEEKTSAVYRTLGAEEHFRSIVYPEVGHAYTPEMRREMLAWFDKWLQP